MARITRVFQKIFAGSATNNGVFGSAQDGTKVTSTSLATLMGKPAYLTGWLDAVMGASKFPPLEEFQALSYIETSQLAYLFQEGVSEYDASTTYYTNGWVKKPSTNQLWVSLTNNNTGNALTDPTNWALLFDFSSPPNGFTTGDTKMTYKTTADTGWIMANDGSIGSASSGATTRANADTAALYALFWANVSNTYAPVSGGRGANAAADFAANKTLTLPAFLGRALGGAGAGSGLTSRSLGQTFGEENHALTSAENAAHTHTNTLSDPGHVHDVISTPNALITSGSSNIANTPGLSSTISTNSATTGVTITNASSGSGTAHNTMQPTAFINMMIKL